ncbi:HET-domain-containing protein [Cadophora sp. DSE1049]|nr:HET-domain-containing protein [Cadophora sp. DSE1049]
MRLLERNSSSEFSLTEDFRDKIPRCAILSYTWGKDTKEVTFKDLIDNRGTSKAGYEKIRFCGQQAKQDSIEYFWVDTCCIDKSNSAELAEAITSMFRDATKCYVYLSDISEPAVGNDEKPDQLPWKSAFCNSEWFSRGWTLQELLAPGSVDFFSQNESGQIRGDIEGSEV